ncbi:MAG: META domain-containing protein, partial [Anaerolineae bacterium]
ATEMACLGPEGVMEQEQRYFEVLGAVTSAHVYAGQLWLATDDGRALVFVAPDPASKAVPQID